jgi:hypothetical protein
MVDITVENVSNEKMLVSPEPLLLRDSLGYEHKVATWGGYRVFQTGELVPGDGRRGILIYEIQSDARPIVLTHEDKGGQWPYFALPPLRFDPASTAGSAGQRAVTPSAGVSATRTAR